MVRDVHFHSCATVFPSRSRLTCASGINNKIKVTSSLGKGRIRNTSVLSLSLAKKFQWKSRKTSEDSGLALKRGQPGHAD